MAKVKFNKSYNGSSSKEKEWEDIGSIFDNIWGKEMRSLPTYPIVIGGVHAYWQKDDDTIINAESFDELQKALNDDEVNMIVISSSIGQDPDAYFFYYPKTHTVNFKIASKKSELISPAISLIKKYFPITDKNVEKITQKTDKNISKKRITNNRLYQKWWMRHLVFPLLVVVIGSFILYKLGLGEPKREVQKTVDKISTTQISNDGENLFSLKPKDIQNQIRGLPILQQEKAGEDYKGIVVNWKVVLTGSPRISDQQYIYMRYAGENPVSGIIIICIIELDKFPELKVFRDNQQFNVKGVIKSASDSTIFLDKCELNFS